MDTNDTSSLPVPDHGPDDSALARLLRAIAAPLRSRPDADVRRSHVAAASAVARGTATAPARSARGRARFGALPCALRGMLRPVFAGGLALSLVAGLVTAVTVGIPGVTLFGDDGEEFELAMAPGFTPSPIPLERTEDYVILTVDADRAQLLSDELQTLAESEPAVLSVRDDRTTFTVPASVAARLELADVEAVADTPISTLSTATTQQPVPSWGLDRIHAVDEPLDGSYGFVSTGAGVRVYVIDTGVRADHADLAGRVVPGWSAIEDGRGSEDCNGHGTHVAGTVAESSFGVAKGTTVVAVRVLDCNGSGFASSVVSGLSWVIANHPGGPGVINMSIGGPANSAVDRAVDDATARGLTVVTAAGNNAGDACDVSPARAASAVTTGATTSSDVRAGYSNVGGCVDLFAPGSGITSAWHTSSGASATLSGTSMAAPHVAGIAARLLQAEPSAGPSRITSLLTGSATTDTVNDPAGSPNLLANLVDFDEEKSECELLYEEGLEEGQPIPEECLEDEEGDEEGDEDDDERERDGEGRPDSPPGLGGLLPPGFGGPIPGLERAPGLDGRLPPGLADREEGRVPPGLADREDGATPGRPDASPPGLADREEGRVPPGLADREEGRVPPGLADRTPPGRPTPAPAPAPTPEPEPAPAPAPAPTPEPEPEQVAPEQAPRPQPPIVERGNSSAGRGVPATPATPPGLGLGRRR